MPWLAVIGRFPSPDLARSVRRMWKCICLAPFLLLSACAESALPGAQANDGLEAPDLLAPDLIADHCSDGVRDADETDVDCGGAVCPRCLAGQACGVGVDCASGRCGRGQCERCTIAFAPQATFKAGDGPLAIADLNGDRSADLAVLDAGVNVFFNRGDGTFAFAGFYDVFGTFLALGDLNGDGRPDMAVAGDDGRLAVLFNQGDGTFGPPAYYPRVGDHCSWIALGDLNGDGKPDIAAACVVVMVLVNKGDGTFGAPVQYDVDAGHTVAIGDVNGDGKPDLVSVNTNAGAAGSQKRCVDILLNRGDGTFAYEHSLDGYGASYCYSAAVGDLRGDGAIDVVGSTLGGEVLVYLNQGKGAFAPLLHYDAGSSPQGLALGDLDGDGKPEIVVADRDGDSVSVFRNDGGGVFAPKVNYAVGSRPKLVAIGDLNGDRKPDLAVANTGDGTVSVLLSTCM